MADKRDRRPRNEQRDLIEDDVIGTGDQEEEEFEEIDGEEEDLDEDAIDEEASAPANG
jgi:hypothetical protein